MRERWPAVGRIAILHRFGDIGIGESSVVVAVSSPHRAEAFEAARFGIDTLKATAPIWKRERWAEGEDWGLGTTAVEDVTRRRGPGGA
jgi:molybdopterin synthase catalytic subunit